MLIVDSLEQAEALKETILLSADTARKNIKEVLEKTSAVELLFEMRFNQIGVDPLKGTKLNLIEQLNQLFSDLVIIEAVKELFLLYPDKNFQLHLGTEAGFDIQSTDGAIVAECFAATVVGSNGKLKEDTEKLMRKAPEQKKYIFFYSRNDNDSALERVYHKFPEVTYRRIKNIV